MTLQDWCDAAGLRAVVKGRARVVPDMATFAGVRARLWDLDDYRVTSVTGGAVWLVPRRVRQRCPLCGAPLDVRAGAIGVPERHRYSTLNGATVEVAPRPATLLACGRCEYVTEAPVEGEAR